MEMQHKTNHAWSGTSDEVFLYWICGKKKQKKQWKWKLIFRSANNIKIPYLQKLGSAGHAKQLKLVLPKISHVHSLGISMVFNRDKKQCGNCCWKLWKRNESILFSQIFNKHFLWYQILQKNNFLKKIITSVMLK